MRFIVAKFGGSSTASAECFKRILDIVNRSLDRRLIVLSAPGMDADHGDKVTALLEECWRRQEEGRPTGSAIRRVCRRYREIAVGLGLSADEIHSQEEIEGALHRSRACVLSRGEYLCAKLFSRFSGIPMADAAELVAFDRGGQLDEARTMRRIARATQGHARLIVPGFYGASPDGRIFTFPRNGSDITGALMAAGADADLYENWTDVPGLMTADPAIVPEARLIPQVGYRQMRCLARAGAQVLHPGCLDPVELAGIPTRLRCSTDPDSFGTLIDEKEDRFMPCIAGNGHAGNLEGRLTAAVSVFGVPAHRVLAASAAIHPLETVVRREQVVFHVEAGSYAGAVRHLHAVLIG